MASCHYEKLSKLAMLCFTVAMAAKNSCTSASPVVNWRRVPTSVAEQMIEVDDSGDGEKLVRSRLVTVVIDGWYG